MYIQYNVGFYVSVNSHLYPTYYWCYWLVGWSGVMQGVIMWGNARSAQPGLTVMMMYTEHTTPSLMTTINILKQ